MLAECIQERRFFKPCIWSPFAKLLCGNSTLAHETLSLIPFFFDCPRCIVVLHKGISQKLEAMQLFTLGDVARASLDPFSEDRLYKTFGVNAELIIDTRGAGSR